MKASTYVILVNIVLMLLEIFQPRQHGKLLYKDMDRMS